MRDQAEEDTYGGGMRVSRTPEARSPRSERVEAAAEPQVYKKSSRFFLRPSGGAAVRARA